MMEEHLQDDAAPMTYDRKDSDLNATPRNPNLPQSSVSSGGGNIEFPGNTTSNFRNPFLDVPKDSSLDPKSLNFDIKAWTSNIVGFTSQNPQQYARRRVGVCFRDLKVCGFKSPTDYQKTVGNVILEISTLFRWIAGTGKSKVRILDRFNGLVEPGEMLLVLGKPGSGCSTLLKTTVGVFQLSIFNFKLSPEALAFGDIVSGEIHGLHIDSSSKINYHGVTAEEMQTQFRGETLYMAETDVHFPQMSVGQTLLFAAKARAPCDHTFPGVTRDMYASHMRDVTLATFGLSHTINTNVGNDLIKGVSGGERKRVSIAEATLNDSSLQCWDNSTRGLDSANALEFCKTLRVSTQIAETTACVAPYQVSQDAYNAFDKVTVLYEGRQIYFGPCKEAKGFFTRMGFIPAPRQTTADFLTSLTNPVERNVRVEFENRTPRNAEEFAAAWEASEEYSQLLGDMTCYESEHPLQGPSNTKFAYLQRYLKSKHQGLRSPYTLSLSQQVFLCVSRGFQRLTGDASVTISRVLANSALALVVGSVFYNLPNDTSSFYSRGVLLFFAILLNAFASALEILLLYDQRPIVEKHARYCLYRPFTEALSSMICDLPYKICNCVVFNVVLYFMTNLRRTPSAFFTFLVISFTTTLALSMLFRTFGAASRSLVQALPLSAIIILALMIYTGFVVPPPYMVPWFSWIRYVNPIAYAFESLMINEFHGRNFPCGNFVPTGPGYEDVGSSNQICSTVGAVLGSHAVSGSDYIRLSFNYEGNHLWRNLGIIIAFTIFLMFTCLAATEYVTERKPKGEVLLFRRRSQKSRLVAIDIETSAGGTVVESPSLDAFPDKLEKQIHHQTSVFQWRNICLDLKVNKKTHRILNHVDGWVKPRTLTALMGPSGAGKTSLLDALAARTIIGLVSGDAIVNGRKRDISFQRKTGYAQQQDVHLKTSTVREALRFSALLRQPENVARKHKLSYVEEIIKLLDMQTYADAIVGFPGEGLNVEQRKKLTIAIELAARPELLIFLDEPTSGLDSQSAWGVLDLLENLTQHGQAILCTIHQPSAQLLERFDRLLFLGPNGHPVYFGELGKNCSTLIGYFERNGAATCPIDANPAEYIMTTLGCVPGSHTDIDWPQVWRNSREFVDTQRQLDEMENNLNLNTTTPVLVHQQHHREYAASFLLQIWECMKRINSQYWRSPTYIYSKTALSVLTGIFLGFSFYKADSTLQGLQNQTFSGFMLLTLSSNLVPQICTNFVVQRSIFEARERLSKTYSWPAFILANILIELPWNTLMAILVFVSWYYPVGMSRNLPASRDGTMLLLVWTYFMYSSTFAHMIQAGVELAEMAGNYANLLFTFSLIFCGILATPAAMPRFWIFMYRVSPFTYLVGAILAVGLAGKPVQCSEIELLRFEPLYNTSCFRYMERYIETNGGYIVNADAMEDCKYCVIANTDAFLRQLGIAEGDVWRNIGVLWVFVLFNIAGAIGFYWLARVPKRTKKDR